MARITTQNGKARRGTPSREDNGSIITPKDATVSGKVNYQGELESERSGAKEDELSGGLTCHTIELDFLFPRILAQRRWLKANPPVRSCLAG